MRDEYAIKGEEHRGLRYKILPDDSAESPRDWDNLGTMACWHRRYNLGDIQPKETAKEHLESLPEGTLILPLYLYDHSGITMNTTGFSCPWDSGQVGYIYVTPEKIKAEFGDAPDAMERARKCLIGEVETYDTFLRGDVVGWSVEATGDSVWGYYSVEDAEAEAKANIDWYLEKQAQAEKTEKETFAV